MAANKNTSGRAYQVLATSNHKQDAHHMTYLVLPSALVAHRMECVAHMMAESSPQWPRNESGPSPLLHVNPSLTPAVPVSLCCLYQ